MSWAYSNNYHPDHNHGGPDEPGSFGNFPGSGETGRGVDHAGNEAFAPYFGLGPSVFGPDNVQGGHGAPTRGPWSRRGGRGANHFNPWGPGRGNREDWESYFREFLFGGPSSSRDHGQGEEGVGETHNPAGPAPAAATAADEHDPEKEDTPDTMRDSPAAGNNEQQHPDPPEEHPNTGSGFGRPGRAGGRGGCPGGFRGRGCGFSRGRRWGHGRFDHGRAGPGAGPNPFDFRGLMRLLANHPFAQQIREQIERAAAGANADEDKGAFGDAETFAPPVDVFDGEEAWTVHVALPGAKKEDVGVSWDAGKSSLLISGVVYRPGDEAFLSGLVTAERKVGLFHRKVKLPPARSTQDNEEVDEEGITARMEDGVLVVVVPKAEKDWTEVKKVDIE